MDRLCLLRGENIPPNKWPLARVERLHPGEDGIVRVVVVRIATSSFTRPLSKIIHSYTHTKQHIGHSTIGRRETFAITALSTRELLRRFTIKT